jgi:hypothetical protein
MRRACRVPALPRGFYADDVWQLLGPADPTSATLIQLYTNAVGTAAEWAAVGLPIRFDAAGAPLPRRHGALSYEYVLRTPRDRERFVSCTYVAEALTVPASPQGTSAGKRAHSRH